MLAYAGLVVVPDTQPIADALIVPATIGELWMVAYLLIRGVRRTHLPVGPAPTAALAAAR